MKFWLTVAAGVVLSTSVLAQDAGGPQTGLPNPFLPPIYDWSNLPSGAPWGQTAGAEIGPHQEIWMIGRCGVNSCDGSDLPPVHLMDMATGKPQRSIGAGLFAFPHGLHVDAQGNVWVTDAASSKDGTKGQQVIKMSPDGKILMRLGVAGAPGGGPDHLQEPCDVITAPNGDIFVADGHSGMSPTLPADYVTRIVKFSKDGKFIMQWGKLGSGPGEFRNPHALAFDKRGRLFVADRGNSRIQIFDQNGTFLAEWKQFGRPSGLYIDKNDTLYAIDADSTARNHPGWPTGIWIGDARTGKVTGFVPDEKAGEGIVIDKDGNAYGALNTPPAGISKYVKKP